MKIKYFENLFFSLLLSLEKTEIHLHALTEITAIVSPNYKILNCT